VLELAKRERRGRAVLVVDAKKHHPLEYIGPVIGGRIPRWKEPMEYRSTPAEDAKLFEFGKSGEH